MSDPDGDKEGRQPVRLPDSTEPSGTSGFSNAGTAAATIPAPTASRSDASDASALHAPPSAVTLRGEQPSTSSVASPSGPAVSQDPSSQLPAIPPRTYPRDTRLLQYTPPQPLQRLRPSQTLPRFIRFLAAFIFIAGSGATLAAFLYRRYLYPRLLLATTRLTELQQSNLSKYDKLLVSLRSLVTDNATLYTRTSTRLIAGRSLADPTLPAAAQADIANGSPPAMGDQASDEKQPQAGAKQMEAEDEAHPLVSQQEDETARKKGEEAAADGGGGAPMPVIDLTHDLREALGKLQTSLLCDKRKSSSVTTEEDKKSYLPEPTPAQSLQRTLDSFATYLANESFYASTPSYPSSAYGYNYGSMGSAIPTRSGMDKDKIAQLKTDIRGLKGALLTRKNFAPVTGR